MTLITGLIEQWRRRLAEAVSLSRGRDDSWLWAIRARVLTFCLARHLDNEAQQAVAERDLRAAAAMRPPTPRPQPIHPMPELIPIDAPPRRAPELRPLADDIHQLNGRARRRRLF